MNKHHGWRDFRNGTCFITDWMDAANRDPFLLLFLY